MVEVMSGVYFAEIDVPYSLVGKTLREASLRQIYEVEVVLLRKPEGNGDDACRFPAPDARLDPDDRLLVMGSASAIRALNE